jgi:hypothetical protein
MRNDQGVETSPRKDRKVNSHSRIVEKLTCSIFLGVIVRIDYV